MKTKKKTDPNQEPTLLENIVYSTLYLIMSGVLILGPIILYMYLTN